MFALNDTGLRLTLAWNIGIRRFFFGFMIALSNIGL
jgi:hypothetical protein